MMQLPSNITSREAASVVFSVMKSGGGPVPLFPRFSQVATRHAAMPQLGPDFGGSVVPLNFEAKAASPTLRMVPLGTMPGPSEIVD
jgi:hypothetical protein